MLSGQFPNYEMVMPKNNDRSATFDTGALSQAILQYADPAAVQGIDRAAEYVAAARQLVQDQRAMFDTGDALALPVETAVCDAVVSGLALNFVPEPERAVRDMARAARSGGIVAAYVWDYAGKMQMLRHFWNAAVALDPNAASLDEGRRFPVCRPEPLADLFRKAGLADVKTRSIDVPTIFKDFDDYWTPFLGGQAPAPGYCMSLSEDRRIALRDHIRADLSIKSDGTIHLIARAWAVRGVVH